MGKKVTRKIVHIDEDKCDGCGQCVPACHEGAIQIIDGKARLVAENLCDGLGDCLGECPQGAIRIEEKEAEPFDEEAVQEHIKALQEKEGAGEAVARGCPSTEIKTMDKTFPEAEAGECPSMLGQWPVQLMLVPPSAPFLQKAELMVVADCVPFAYGNFHQHFLRGNKGNAIGVGCPKLDDARFYVQKLAEIFKLNDISRVTVIVMEVPCCAGLETIVKAALEQSGKDIAVDKVVISSEGKIVEE